MSDKIYHNGKEYQNAVFKTPSSKTKFYTPLKSASSEESLQSQGDVVSSSQSDSEPGTGDLSLIAEFDEIVRMLKHQRNEKIEDAFLSIVEKFKEGVRHLCAARKECERLQMELENKVHDLSDLERKLNHARKMIDNEKKQNRKIEDEKDYLEAQIKQVHEFIKRTRLPDDTREKLGFLSKYSEPQRDTKTYGAGAHLSAIQEVNTTGSLLSDFSYSRSEDDLDVSDLNAGKGWKKHRPSDSHVIEPCFKKRKSSGSKVVEIANNDSVKATTTVTIPKNGPITATSIIEAVPALEEHQINNNQINLLPKPSAPPSDILFDMWQNSPNKQNYTRQHTLQAKTVVMPDICGPCEKRIRFGKTILKCKDCRAACHPECKQDLPLPCIPFTPTRNLPGLISDYTPTTPPMVPALIVHCTNEIEARGLQEIGLYRVPGSEKDVKLLKEKFLRGKGAPSLNQVDVHVICGTLKAFLRSLHEPLITYKLWPTFVQALEGREEQEISSSLYKTIGELPQPNRDTLAHMIVHLKRISNAKECKMPISNLSKIFGPTIVGYSSNDPNPDNIMYETKRQNQVMEFLMNLPTDYWMSFLNVQDIGTPKLQQTPSTDSLLRPGLSYTPNFARSNKRKPRIFATPPNYKY